MNNSNENVSLEEIVRNDRVYDSVYTLDSLEVIKWTEHFKSIAQIDKMFEHIWTLNKTPSKIIASTVGTFWHHFSSIAPKVMCIGAGKLNNNEMRHYVIQPVYEELGKRHHRDIHPKRFLECIESIGVSNAQRIELVKDYLYKFPFLELQCGMENASTDQEILGIFLGLEINAIENIDTLVSSLSYCEDSKSKVDSSWFFKVHNVAEEEHVRLNVANFLRFSPSDKDKESFLLGFSKSISFWNKYWECISHVIEHKRMA